MNGVHKFEERVDGESREVVRENVHPRLGLDVLPDAHAAALQLAGHVLALKIIFQGRTGGFACLQGIDTEQVESSDQLDSLTTIFPLPLGLVPLVYLLVTHHYSVERLAEGRETRGEAVLRHQSADVGVGSPS